MARKKTKPLRNPFVYEGYEGPSYFCDRTEETEKVISHLQNGRNLTLVSPRKVGKTGLIKHVFQRLKQENENNVCIYVDIFHTQNQYELVQTLGRAIVEEQLFSTRSSMEKVLSFFSMWRPTVSPDPITGMPTVSVSIERTQTEHTLKSIFDYLEKSEKEVYVAIDEFQTITDYPEKGTEALLRSYIQFIHHVHFIYAGSRQHLMYEMFGSSKRPFYQSTAMLTLQPLHEEIYYDFAARFFKARNGDFSADVFQRLYKQFNGYTWYMQSVLNRLYEHERRVTDYQQVNEAILSILADKSSQYETLMMFLTDNQKSLLKAVALENKVAQPQSLSFAKKHELPSASSIKKALEVLKEKDIIYQTPEGYIVYDRFLDLWLKRTFM
ncbi:MAG: orc1/cdc6 family replication initiation protein [Prevotella sp.]|nr:orc1/cdc6 family replication initiation protein [Prevotella sp.]